MHRPPCPPLLAGRLGSALIALAALLVLGVGCADESPPGRSGDNNASNNAAQNSGNNAENNASNNADNNGNNADNNASNNANNADNNGAPIVKVGFGEPCRSNLNCESGFCISSPQGFVCTSACTDAPDCPALDGKAMDCRATANFGADGINICVPTTSSLCSPCFQDSNCFGGLCVPTVTGSVCGADCVDDGDCPLGTTCFQFAPTGEALARSQCLPTNLSCGCDATTAGQTRPCVQLGDGGNRCFGQETCDPEQGWVGCDASIPTLEVCDGADNDCNGAIDDGLPLTEPCTVENAFGTCTGVRICDGATGLACLADEPAAEGCDLRDNDCDGQVDEDFKTGEVLSALMHCGACGNDCTTRFPLAESVECRVEGDAASCAITACRQGYVLAGPTTCLPLASRLCSPCGDDADCNTEVGDRCVSYGAQAFCGRDCGPGSPFGQACPMGYACNAEGQCQLEAGTCLCGPGDNFIRPCSIPDPNDPAVSCVGSITCTNGQLSECVPPVDECNGVDDDCNGIIDEGLRDEETERYITDAHCGRCFNDCALQFNDPSYNAEGVCSGLAAAQRGEIPACVLDCDEGYRDVNGTTVDGCECEILTPGIDDPDPSGIDADCDGIDGQIPRGVFVAPTGDDANAGTIDAPLRRVQTGINRAGGGRDHVYVAAGVYNESVTLRAGVSVFGGYSADFRQRDLAGNETAIFGAPPTPQARGAVNAANITTGRTTLAGFTIVGASNDAPTASSYAIYVRNSTASLELRNNVIRAGNGGPGQRGGSGTPAIDAPDNATAGAIQRLSQERQCSSGNNANRSLGGSGGQNQCTDQQGAAVNAHGGGGGTSNCPDYDEAEQAGMAGVTAPRNGSGGAGGYNAQLFEDGLGRCLCLVPTVAGSTSPGVPGTDGRPGDPGTPGQGCAVSPGRVVNGEWVAGATRGNPTQTFTPSDGFGGDGWKGLPGGGGGGGGGGAGIEVLATNQYTTSCRGFFEAIGGGGGGGGAGACGGTGGTGGSPGGGSFGVFITFDATPASLPDLRDNRVERGRGGDGGDGGQGADGGDGAPGKAGMDIPDAQIMGLLACSDPGGRGGDGGNGGAGGGGGGGCGGIAAGIYVSGQGGLATGPYRTQNTFPAVGGAGLGGQPGSSTGTSGSAGADGLFQEVVP